MKFINKKLIFGIIAGFVLAFSLVNFSFAATANFIGNIDDDGGDPNLYVWFQYGKTTSYGYETSRQAKYGIGEFTAAVSGLEDCTTYHYRAAARHQSFDDTRYGENKTFITACSIKVDLKANGSDGPISVPYTNRTINLSWTSQYADTCTASGDWSGSKLISGSESITLSQVRTYTFTLTCRNNTTGNTSIDSVQATLSVPNPPTVVTKGVVVTY